MPLKSRRSFPPGQFQFFQAQTGWPKKPSELMGLTFDQVVDRIIQHRAANPRYANQWSTERAAVEGELDEYTCLRIGNDPNYCAGSAPPFSQGQPQRPRLVPEIRSEKDVAVAARMTVGAMTLAEWFGDGANPVAREQAEKRAAVCVVCPLNKKGEWKDFFTIAAATTIQKTISLARREKIETSRDAELGLCEACGCVNTLKVHVPIQHITAKMPPETFAALDEKCWIRSERST